MTDAPSTRFVDGLRVTPAHLNHLHSVASAAIADLRRLVGRDRVALGFRRPNRSWSGCARWNGRTRRR